MGLGRGYTLLLAYPLKKPSDEGLFNGATDGIRTHDHSDHNRGLYQLSYGRHKRKMGSKLVGSSFMLKNVDFVHRKNFSYGRNILDVLIPNILTYQSCIFCILTFIEGGK